MWFLETFEQRCLLGSRWLCCIVLLMVFLVSLTAFRSSTSSSSVVMGWFLTFPLCMFTPCGKILHGALHQYDKWGYCIFLTIANGLATILSLMFFYSLLLPIVVERLEYNQIILRTGKLIRIIWDWECLTDCILCATWTHHQSVGAQNSECNKLFSQWFDNQFLTFKE